MVRSKEGELLHIDYIKKVELPLVRRRSNQNSSIIQAIQEIDQKHVNNEDFKLKVLSDQSAIYFNKIWPGEYRDTVQPGSPRGDFDFESSYESVPDELPSLEDLNIPLVKQLGVKECIRILGNYFQCESYQTNMCHFWFLDILVDSLWKMQDDYNFTTHHQKIVMGWIIFIFNLLRGEYKKTTVNSVLKLKTLR